MYDFEKQYYEKLHAPPQESTNEIDLPLGSIVFLYGQYTTRATRKTDKKPTIKLSNVHDGNGRQIRDHVWLDGVSSLVNRKIRAGDHLYFSATVDSYNRDPKRRQLKNAMILKVL